MGRRTYHNKGKNTFSGVNPPLCCARVLLLNLWETFWIWCLLFFFLGLFCGQDVAVMEYPGSTDMSKGLRCLTRTSYNNPLFSFLVPFNARELACSLPGARPQPFTQRHGEEPERKHQGPAPFQLHRPSANRF